MMDVWVLVGSPGAGKSELARALWPAEVIEFDHGVHHLQRNATQFIDAVVQRIQASSANAFVIDGWFRWNLAWASMEDKTLEQLGDRLGGAYRIRLVLLGMSPAAAITARAYKAKPTDVAVDQRADMRALIDRVADYCCGGPNG